MTSKKNDDKQGFFWRTFGLEGNTLNKELANSKEMNRIQSKASESSLQKMMGWVHNFTDTSIARFGNNFDCSIGIGFCHSEENTPRLW
mmetsp:Transcript_39531/g.45989  ORF Transcript_39531/g.45989 Transcript_39531/m.45989 type:complete len:88 (-) Transcript_39531:203-466(-)